MCFAIYFVPRTLAFFCSRIPTMAVPHCSELSRAMETGIIQRNKIGRDEQYAKQKMNFTHWFLRLYYIEI